MSTDYDEGYSEGFDAGKDEGLEEGRSDGECIGRESGLENAAEFIRKLCRNHKVPSFVAKYLEPIADSIEDDRLYETPDFPTNDEEPEED